MGGRDGKHDKRCNATQRKEAYATRYNMVQKGDDGVRRETGDGGGEVRGQDVLGPLQKEARVPDRAFSDDGLLRFDVTDGLYNVARNTRRIEGLYVPR